MEVLAWGNMQAGNGGMPEGWIRGKSGKNTRECGRVKAESEKTENLTLKQNMGTALQVVEGGKPGQRSQVWKYEDNNYFRMINLVVRIKTDSFSKKNETARNIPLWPVIRTKQGRATLLFYEPELRSMISYSKIWVTHLQVISCNYFTSQWIT